jgi:CxxC motif-containing protein (DUF1111 family)
MVRSGLVASLALAASALAAAPALDIEIGKRLFERGWVSAPASAQSVDGLGPLSDARSCAACHAERIADMAASEDGFARIVIRLGNQAGDGDPRYGRQLQLLTVRDVPPEAVPELSWRHEGALRHPAITLHDLGYGPLAGGTKLSLRRASGLMGIGLLARIPEDEILKFSDPEDKNGDGISGRPAWLTNANGRPVLGRFGWRASEGTLTSQTEAAFSNDIGMSTTGRPASWGDCTEAQTACRGAPHGAAPGEVEIPDSSRDLIAAFLEADLRATPVPAGRGADLFETTGCAGCHATPLLPGGARAFVYTDLLLHDLGEGLNDGIKEGAAEPGEWRTAPLRGMAALLRAGGLLHDGRARNVGEAIEWHGGEGASSRARFRALNSADRAALLAFVNGL